MDRELINQGGAVNITPKKKPLVSGASVVIMPSQVHTISQIAASGPVTPQKQLGIKVQVMEKRIQESKQLLVKVREAKTVQEKEQMEESLKASVMLQEEEFAAIDQLSVIHVTPTVATNNYRPNQRPSKGPKPPRRQVVRRKTFAGLQQTTLILELSDEDEEEE